MKRRISHSPVSVNTTYELSETNTKKLWSNFEEHLRQSIKKSNARDTSAEKFGGPPLSSNYSYTKSSYLTSNEKPYE